MIVGMDFGTTNSGMAAFDGQRLQLLPLDPANSNPAVARTALYLTNDQRFAIGRDALDRYFDENSGRPVKMKRVWVGEIEVYGADMYYVTDLYTWIDTLSPGRLFLSLKTGLRDPDYQGTVVGPFYYSLENLIAIYMSLARIRATRLLGQPISEVVLGRPVRFSTDPKADSLAQRRLLEAAFRAGYEKVYLQHEPTAAAHYYAAGINRAQNILVFDFGGGTLDLTVMRLDGRQERRVLSTGGIPVAGDVFDQKVVRARLPRHFGEGSRYRPAGQSLPLPKWIFDVFSDWRTISELQTPNNQALLNQIAQTVEDRKGIESLISLISHNYSLSMFDAVEKAKRELSSKMATLIRLSGPGFKVTEPLSRTHFEGIIRAEVAAIDAHLDETVAEAGLEPDQIDAVIRTGGSSSIPIFQRLLMDKFGEDRLVAADTFSSVTSGLAIMAHRIMEGEIEARAYTPDDGYRPSQASYGREVTGINLSLLQKRMVSQEKGSAGEEPGLTFSLVDLLNGGGVRISPLSRAHMVEEASFKAPEVATTHDARSAVDRPAAWLVKASDQLLMITSRYRFLLATANRLAELEEIGLDAAGYFQLKVGEAITALASWEMIKTRPRLIMTTTQGFIRSYRLDQMVSGIEGPTPYQFDDPLPGLPFAIHGSGNDDHLTLILDSGRAVRHPVSSLPSRGLQAINRRSEEWLVGAVVSKPDDQLLITTETGYGRRLAAGEIPQPNRPNTRGKVQIARRPVVGLSCILPAGHYWARTSRRLLAINPFDLKRDEVETTRSYRLLKLSKGEKLLGLLDGPFLEPVPNAS